VLQLPPQILKAEIENSKHRLHHVSKMKRANSG
jgi:hypothetical protein